MFSVIVPVYNTAAYLDRSIRSVLAQTEPDFEIIAVDDGSTDDSPHILEAIAQEDARLRVFTQTNGGQGSARNRALSLARGRYVTFVDSDDTVSPDLLARVAEVLSDPSLDVVSFGIEFRDDQGNLVAERGPTEEFTSTGDVIFLDAMLDRNFMTSVCNKAYRRALLVDHAITFPELRAFEDSVFSRHVARHARAVRYIKERLYAGLTRAGSTSRGLSRTSFAHAATMIAVEKQMFSDGETDPVRVAAFRAHVARFLGYLLVLAAFRIDDPAERAECRHIADAAGFTACAKDRQAMALLAPRVRAQIWVARFPTLLRLAAAMARRFNRVPY